jgi:hypothetical protein
MANNEKSSNKMRDHVQKFCYDFMMGLFQLNRLIQMIVVFTSLFLLQDMHLELNTIDYECFSFVFGSSQKLVTIADIQT